jgi:hypothetical protein
MDVRLAPFWKNTPISFSLECGVASERGHAEVFKVLLEYKDEDGNLAVDPAAADNHATRLASENGHFVVVKGLSEYKDKDGNLIVNPGSSDSYAISSASENGHARVVEILFYHPKVSSNLTPMDIRSLFHTLKNALRNRQVQTCLLKVFAGKYPGLDD